MTNGYEFPLRCDLSPSTKNLRPNVANMEATASMSTFEPDLIPATRCHCS